MCRRVMKRGASLRASGWGYPWKVNNLLFVIDTDLLGYSAENMKKVMSEPGKVSQGEKLKIKLEVIDMRGRLFECLRIVTQEKDLVVGGGF